MPVTEFMPGLVDPAISFPRRLADPRPVPRHVDRGETRAPGTPSLRRHAPPLP
jgi:hypothetical protein